MVNNIPKGFPPIPEMSPLHEDWRSSRAQGIFSSQAVVQPPSIDEEIVRSNSRAFCLGSIDFSRIQSKNSGLDDFEYDEATLHSDGNLLRGLTLTELQKLQHQFYAEDCEGQIENLVLPLDVFIRALGFRLDKMSENEANHQKECLTRFFHSVDKIRKGDGISWCDIANFLLRYPPESGGLTGVVSVSTDAPKLMELITPKIGEDSHSDWITAFLLVGIPNSDPGETTVNQTGHSLNRRYVTAGRDGALCAWTSTFLLLQKISIGSCWRYATALCLLRSTKRIAAAVADFAVLLYNEALTVCLGKIGTRGATPVNLAYTNHEGVCPQQDEILMIGDEAGYVTINFFKTSESSTDTAGHPSMKLPCSQIAVKCFSRTKYHVGAVTQIQYLPDIQSMVTSGADGSLNICDIQKNCAKRERVLLHQRGVHCWVWCASLQFFASAGIERAIRIWNPYTVKTLHNLLGHTTPVRHLQLSEGQFILISLSDDKILKLWDIRNFYCMQTVPPPHQVRTLPPPYDEEGFSACAIDIWETNKASTTADKSTTNNTRCRLLLADRRIHYATLATTKQMHQGKPTTRTCRKEGEENKNATVDHNNGTEESDFLTITSISVVEEYGAAEFSGVNLLNGEYNTNNSNVYEYTSATRRARRVWDYSPSTLGTRISGRSARGWPSGGVVDNTNYVFHPQTETITTRAFTLLKLQNPPETRLNDAKLIYPTARVSSIEPESNKSDTVQVDTLMNAVRKWVVGVGCPV